MWLNVEKHRNPKSRDCDPNELDSDPGKPGFRYYGACGGVDVMYGAPRETFPTPAWLRVASRGHPDSDSGVAAGGESDQQKRKQQACPEGLANSLQSHGSISPIIPCVTF